MLILFLSLERLDLLSYDPLKEVFELVESTTSQMNTSMIAIWSTEEIWSQSSSARDDYPGKGAKQGPPQARAQRADDTRQ